MTGVQAKKMAAIALIDVLSQLKSEIIQHKQFKNPPLSYSHNIGFEHGKSTAIDYINKYIEDAESAKDIFNAKGNTK